MGVTVRVGKAAGAASTPWLDPDHVCHFSDVCLISESGTPHLGFNRWVLAATSPLFRLILSDLLIDPFARYGLPRFVSFEEV